MAMGISVFDGVPTNHAQIPWVRGSSSTAGWFIGARVNSTDLAGVGDTQVIASQYFGPGTSENQYAWQFSLADSGLFSMGFIESGSTTYAGSSPDVQTDHGIIDGDDFWVGVAIWFDGGARIQLYWGGEGATPSWATWGAAGGPNAGVINLRQDIRNVSIGDGRYGSGPEDEWVGTIYEVFWEFGEGGPGVNSRDWHFNGADFVVGDGNTDTAVGSAGNTWTLTGDASMITDDAAPSPTPVAVTTGTLATEAGVVAGGETIIITLTDDTWVATAGDDNAITQAIIDGLDSAGAEAAGWDAIVPALIAHGDVTRTSATVLTIILPAAAAYAITANEVVTATVPATALTAAGDVVATSPLTITDNPAIPVVAAGGGASDADLGRRH
ncbi:MAG: hypothetical protein V3W06_02200, partial [Acidimicrobiia bacterium]